MSGSVVRLSPNLFSISDPLLLPEVYYPHLKQTPFYSTGLALEIASLLRIQDDKDHAAKLKILAPTVKFSRVLGIC